MKVEFAEAWRSALEHCIIYWRDFTPGTPKGDFIYN